MKIMMAVLLRLEIRNDITQQSSGRQIVDQQDVFRGRSAHDAGVRKKALKLAPLKVASICGSVTNVACVATLPEVSGTVPLTVASPMTAELATTAMVVKALNWSGLLSTATQ